MGALRDSLNRLNQPQRGRPRRDPAAALHAKIVMSAWIHAEGGKGTIGGCTSRRKGPEDELDMRSDEISAYLRGKRSFSKSRLRQLAQRHPSLAPVIDWPISLLSERELSARQISRLMGPYLVGPPRIPGYQFPGDDASARAPVRSYTAFRDLERLFERGDAYGFLAIVESYRSYHLDRLQDDQWFAARYMVRALPAFCRHPFVRDHADDAIKLAKRLLVLLPDTSFRIKVDDHLLRRQIEAVSHEPCRALQFLPGSQARIMDEPQDPVIHYKYVRCRPGEGPILPSL